MENSPQLLPDFTLVYQVIIFFASYFVLRQLVFKPYLALLKLRNDKTVGLKEKAVQAQARAENLRSEYEAFMTQERKKIAAWSDDQRRKVADEEKGIIQAARDAVGRELEALRKKLDEEVASARHQLMPHVAEYSSSIATKLVGRTVDASHFPSGAESFSETSQPVG